MPLGVGTIIAGTSLGMNLLGSAKASKKAKEAGRLNAANIRAETAETIRRTKMQNDAFLGTAIAGLGGAGVRGGSGTPSAYLGSAQAEMQNQLDWTQRSGDLRANLARKTGQQVGQSSMISGLTNTFVGLGSMYTQGMFTPEKMTGYSPTQFNAYGGIGGLGGRGYSPYGSLDSGFRS